MLLLLIDSDGEFDTIGGVMDDLRYVPVSRKVNNPRNKGPEGAVYYFGTPNIDNIISPS